MKHLILLLALSIALQAQAQPQTQATARTRTVTTQLHSNPASGGKGAALRGAVNDLARLISAKQFDQAKQAAQALCKKYEAMFDPARRQYVFESRDEFEEFTKSHDGKLEWIDWGYQQCLHAQAFVAAERRDFATALAVLTRIEALAPMSAGVSTEMGYIFGQSNRAQDGLAAYRRAIATSQKYSSQRRYHALALRGAGFALIEMHRLDEAEKALRESLKIDPANPVALNELDYIQDLRKAH